MSWCWLDFLGPVERTGVTGILRLTPLGDSNEKLLDIKTGSAAIDSGKSFMLLLLLLWWWPPAVPTGSLSGWWWWWLFFTWIGGWGNGVITWLALKSITISIKISLNSFEELLLCYYLLLLVELSTFAPDEWIPGNGWRLIVVVVVWWRHGGGRQLRSGNAPDVGRWTTSAGNHRWHVIITQTGSLCCHVVNRSTHNNNRQELFPGHTLHFHTHTHQKLFLFFFRPPQRRMAAAIFFVRVVFRLRVLAAAALFQLLQRTQ